MSPLKFLVVDDNKDAADSMAMLLEVSGHHATPVYCSKDGLDIFAVQKFDVVLLDIGLPDINGYKVAEMIRASAPDQIMVAISGYGEVEDVRKAVSAGFNSHLTKPVSLEQLESAIATLIDAN